MSPVATKTNDERHRVVPTLRNDNTGHGQNDHRGNLAPCRHKARERLRVPRTIENSGSISCISDVLAFADDNARLMLHNNTNDMSWYRGQSDYEWHLVPAVFRNNRFRNETIYVKELERLRPEEFAGQISFEKLVKMQHYGLPTRLLDITSNPLVALYFACSSNKTADGSLYYFASPTFWDDNWAINLVADYVFNPISCLQDLLEREDRRLPDPKVQLMQNEREHLLIHTLTVPAHAVIPKNTNQRLRQQQGGFLVFGMSIEDMATSQNIGTYGNRYISFRELDAEKESSICPVIKKLRIPADRKDHILEELHLLGIDEAVLFPELEHQANYVVERVSRDKSQH